MKNTIIILSFLALIFSSCEKVIQLDLKSSETKYVLKGEVISGDSTHHLSITTTIPFDQANSFPGITGATVTLSDNFGNTTTLLELGGGEYVAQNFLAYEGRTYTMKVKIGDDTIESSCTIPYLVPLVAAVPLPSNFFGLEGNLIVPLFEDPAEYVNFYRFRFFEKDSLLNDSGFILFDDAISNGLVNQQPTIGNYFPISGDTVIYRMYGIPESVHTFYYSKNTNTNSGSGSPANPISNWVGLGALGYFTAHNVQELQIVIP